jgi:prepilin-type N-terminal cleavage/methylation domain-containing protein
MPQPAVGSNHGGLFIAWAKRQEKSVASYRVWCFNITAPDQVRFNERGQTSYVPNHFKGASMNLSSPVLVVDTHNASQSAQNLTRRRQRGLTMVELSVVLVIAALLIAAVFTALNANQRRVELRDNQALITQIASELQGKFGRTGQYANTTLALAVQSRAIPEELRVAGTNTAQNGYGGLIALAAQTCTVANDCLDLTWPQVPQAQCMDLVIGTQNVARRISVNGVVVKALDGALNLGTLATNCEAAGIVPVLYSIGRG